MQSRRTLDRLPKWIPQDVLRYLEHTEAGVSIRSLARRSSAHPSTISRQIRRLECRRDDPLVDAMLMRLADGFYVRVDCATSEEIQTMQHADTDSFLPSSTAFEAEAQRVLRRLCETGAVLAVAADMDKAVVVRETGEAQTRTAVVARDIVEALALKEWITCPSPGRISRYIITSCGRSSLNRMMAEAESKAVGFAEAQAAFEGAPDLVVGEVIAHRFSAADSPLAALARRRDRDGSPFLNDAQVAAGERLREDFELAQLDAGSALDWSQILTDHETLRNAVCTHTASIPAQASQRVVGALQELGTGLADVTLRCCCFLEGLESAEKRLGWSARSGKIVLRIALTRLSEYYRSQAGQAWHMIG